MSKISQLCNLSSEATDRLVECVEEFKFKKNSIVLNEGRTCNYLYYIQSGMMSSYYLSDKREVCNWIAVENDFAASYYSFVSRVPSYETIECLENTTVQAINHARLEDMYKRFPESERAGRLILEEYYIRLEERLISIQFKSARERYDQLFKTRPEIIKRAPLGYIASYLGITQETLSRLRAEH